MPRTKIVATIGPASSAPEVITAMLAAGVDVVRFNFSHGDYDSHREMMETVREAAAWLNLPIALMADTKGPEVRIGEVANSEVEIRTGQMIKISGANQPTTAEEITIPLFDMLQNYCRENGVILFDDGNLEVNIKEVTETEVLAEVIDGGILRNRKKVTIPHVTLPLPILTEKDKEDIKFSLGMEVDFLALSFIRNRNDIDSVREFIKGLGKSVFLIAKIECSEAVNNIDEIIEAADGIMVARGDLGVELEPEEVPLIQKQIIKKCNQAGKPVITATQMLESMIENPRPTRAEAADVANAILDGTDAVMLSGETASGKFPVMAVRMMARVSWTIERSFPFEQTLRLRREGVSYSVADAVSHATCQSAWNLKAAAIISATTSGKTAALISRYRPCSQIIAATPREATRRVLQLYWGVHSIMIPPFLKVEEMIEQVEKICTQNDLLKKGDLVVFTAGVPLGGEGKTNFLKVHQVLSEPKINQLS